MYTMIYIGNTILSDTTQDACKVELQNLKKSLEDFSSDSLPHGLPAVRSSSTIATYGSTIYVLYNWQTHELAFLRNSTYTPVV